jgi:hypothetical protein
MNGGGFQSEGVLESFEESQILGYVIVLTSDPLGDSDPAALGIINDDANTGRARIAQGPPVDVSH